MSRVDWGWVAAVALIVWPFAVCALLGLHRGGHALGRLTRRTARRRKPRAVTTIKTTEEYL